MGQPRVASHAASRVDLAQLYSIGSSTCESVGS